MREVSEVKNILQTVRLNAKGEASRPLLRWIKDTPFKMGRVPFGERETVWFPETEDISAADIAEMALQAIHQLEAPQFALKQLLADTEKDLAAERSFIRRLLEGLRR